MKNLKYFSNIGYNVNMPRNLNLKLNFDAEKYKKSLWGRLEKLKKFGAAN